jgi:hypothetical protein
MLTVSREGGGQVKYLLTNWQAQKVPPQGIAVFFDCFVAKQEGVISGGVELANDAKRICVRKTGDTQYTFLFKAEDTSGPSEGTNVVMNESAECHVGCWDLKDSATKTKYMIRLKDEDSHLKMVISMKQGGQVQYSLSAEKD